jgi:GntR family transcriptional repressor for pyruvate dehydrogenase complex
LEFAPIESRQLFEEALSQIADAVWLGDLAIGDRLPSERVMAEQMNISRPTLREAIRALTDCGLLEVRPGAGTYVRGQELLAGVVEERARIRIGEVAEVLEARRALEPQIAQLAGISPRASDLAAMQKAIDRQARAGRDRDRFLRYEIAFHMSLARAAQNSVLVPLMRRILAKVESAMDMVLLDHDLERTLDIHARTLEAIRGGDPGEIDAVMDEHLAMTEAVWEETTRGPRPRLLGRRARDVPPTTRRS